MGDSASAAWSRSGRVQVLGEMDPDSDVCGYPVFWLRAPRRVTRKIPEIVPPAEFAAQLVVEAPPHLAQPAPAEVTAEAVLVPVLVDGLQEVAVPDVLLAASACQQGWGDLQHLIHRLPGKKAKREGQPRFGEASTWGQESLWAKQGTSLNCLSVT